MFPMKYLMYIYFNLLLEPLHRFNKYNTNMIQEKFFTEIEIIQNIIIYILFSYF